MSKPLFVLYFVLSIIAAQSYAQGKFVSVNKSTGTANVIIPLYSISSGSVSLPVEIIYTATGVKPTDVEGGAGLGWNLSAGGAVTRQLRGLPDDVQKDLNGNTRNGWLYNNDATKPINIPITNNNSSLSTVTADVNTINSNSYYADYSDSEPDIFSVTAPGLSCQLVFDNSKIIRTIPYQDLRITVANNTDGTIKSFTILNDHGITYTFAAAEPATRMAYDGNNSIPYFRHDWQQYQNGIAYTSAWDLTQISDVFNNTIYITYTAGPKKGSDVPVQLYLNGSTTASTVYNVWQNNIPNLVSSIYTDNNTVSGAKRINFIYQTNTYSHVDVVSNISDPNTVGGTNKSINFVYASESDTIRATLGTHYFLRQVYDAQNCNSPLNYHFKYAGDLRAGPNAPAKLQALVGTLLADSTTMGIDYWGYYNAEGQSNYSNGAGNTSLQPYVYINPSNTSYSRYTFDGSTLPSIYTYQIPGWGIYRGANSASTYGTLDTIAYPDGGETYLKYTMNDYYNPVTSVITPGNGIRVTEIDNYDGISTANTIATTYNYNDPATNKSSGKPISLPLFAFSVPGGTGTGQSLWNSSTAVSASDLSQDDHTIIYGSVTETRTSTGSTLYQFSTPVTEWDVNAPSGLPAWSPTNVYAGVTAGALGQLKNDVATWPFPYNLNYDFERGLPTLVRSYNDNGQPVSETDYTYTTPQTPAQITAFKYEVNGVAGNSTINGENYGKYYIYYGLQPVAVLVINKVYDLSADGTPLTTYKTTTINNQYNSAQYKLSQQSTTNSDGTLQVSNTKYVKDYSISGAGDAATTALIQLQSDNINTPVEKYLSVTPSGGSAIVTSGQLIMYGTSTTPNGNTVSMPAQMLNFTAGTGTSATFVPSNISGGNTFQHDPSYNIDALDHLQYDNAGTVLSSGDGYHHIATTITNHTNGKTVAVFNNANYNEIIYNDFITNDEAGLGFPISGSGTTARVNGTGYSFSGTTSKTITKNVLATNYIFSLWVMAYSTGTLSVSIQGGSVTKSATYSYPVTAPATPATPTGWQYWEVKIPVSTMTGSTITVTMTSTNSVQIGDVLCYPDVAEATTYAYDINTNFKTAETNTNGVSTYFSSDNAGRPLYQYDQDKNILLRNTYVSAANYLNFTNPSINPPSPIYNHIGANFVEINTYNPCVAAGLIYSWNFGDQTGPFTSTGAQAHTYLTNGTYNVTVTATSPVYGSQTSAPVAITVSSLPQTNLTYTNATNVTSNPKTNCSITSFVFTQGSTTNTYTQQSFQSTLNITPASYSVTLNIFGPQYNVNGSNPNGYASIIVSDNNGNVLECFPYQSSGTVTFPLNTTYLPGVNFKLSTAACSGGGVQ